MTPQHRRKFADFIRMCEEAKANGVEIVVVAKPTVLGDDYEELVTNLSLLAQNGLNLGMAGPE